MPGGPARIWFYRDYEPSVSCNLANVALNGAIAGSVRPDGNVAPGHDVNQAKDVDLAAGQEAVVKILALSSWESGGERATYQRDTFHVSLMLPQVARAEMASH